MKLQTKQASAKFRRILLVAALAVCPLIASQTGNAQTIPPNVTGTLTQQTTGLQTFTITSNQTFTLDLNITTTFASNGITFYLTTGANGNNLFQIVGRSNVGGVYGDPTSSTGAVTSNPGGRLDPVNNFDLGFTNFVGDPGDVNPDPAGTYFVASYSLMALNLAPGQYTIFVTGSGGAGTSGIVSDSNFATHQLLTNTVTLNVIPEPTTIGLAVIGGALLLVVAWRKQHARA